MKLRQLQADEASLCRVWGSFKGDPSTPIVSFEGSSKGSIGVLVRGLGFGLRGLSRSFAL